MIIIRKKKSRYEHLNASVDSRGVAVVRLNRPEVRNAFNQRTVGELKHLFKTLDHNDKVKVVVLQGAGKSFCAGADLNWMKGMIHYGFEENFRDAKNLAVMLEQIRVFSKPLIVKLTGAAIGGGSGISCLADYVLAERSLTGEGVLMGFPEPSLGIRPSTISPHVIERLGAEAALAYFLSGHIFDCEEAQQIGLIDELHSPSSIDAAVEAKVQQALKYGKMAIRRPSPKVQMPTNIQNHLEGNLAKIQELVIHVVNLLLDEKQSREDLMNYTAADIARARISEEGQYKMRQFLQKKFLHQVA